MAHTPINVFSTGNSAKQISRQKLLVWFNTFLYADFKSIEQLATGAAYCQLLDVLFPGVIPLKKVHFYTCSSYHFLQNFKLVQAAFEELGIMKAIPVENMVKVSFKDNFEFAQWFKKFFDANYKGNEYNPVFARRGFPMGFDENGL